MQNKKPEAARRDVPPDWDEPPPFLRTWKRVYWTVVLYTVALILALYIMTKTLNR